MKRKCIGCGLEYEGSEVDLCPRDVGNGKQCACLAEIIEQGKKKSKKAVESAEGEDHGSN